MAIKNYTTKIDPLISIGEIQASLAQHGARKMMIEYNLQGEPEGLAFTIEFDRQVLGFQLPAHVDGVNEVFKKQKVRSDAEQAKRTAWRNIRDWVLAQMAFIESGNATIEEVFLPFLRNEYGVTLYDLFTNGNLLLGNPEFGEGD